MSAWMITRRHFIEWCAAGGVAANLASISGYAVAQSNAITPVIPGPEVDEFKRVQRRLLLKYDVSARSRYLKLKRPPLKVHVLEAGQGEPVLLLHGGLGTGCLFAPLMSTLQKDFRLFAVDRSGCGLTDKIDYRGISIPEHAVNFVTGVLDGLSLRKASIIGSSIGGWWALLFALAHPERVSRLVLIGVPAGIVRPQPAPPPDPKAPASPQPQTPTIQSTRAFLQFGPVANADRVPVEVLEQFLAAGRLPGVALGRDTMGEWFRSHDFSTYSLRSELKRLGPEALFVLGDKETLGQPTLVQEILGMSPHAKCEVVHDAGHLVWLDQPERCAQLTSEFLKPT